MRAPRFRGKKSQGLCAPRFALKHALSALLTTLGAVVLLDWPYSQGLAASVECSSLVLNMNYLEAKELTCF